MIKRLEQVAALVVAAGLAIVSYWLFFSWAQGGGSERRPIQRRTSLLQDAAPSLQRAGGLPSPGGEPRVVGSEAAAGLDQPLFGGAVVKAGDMGLHLLLAHRQALGLAESHDAAEGSARILQGLTEQGLGELAIGADQAVELSGIAGGHRFLPKQLNPMTKL
jgi:hypothetical protein